MRGEVRSFLRYYYDNPAIESEEDASSPCFGYAENFAVLKAEQRPVIASGMYLGIDGR